MDKSSSGGPSPAAGAHRRLRDSARRQAAVKTLDLKRAMTAAERAALEAELRVLVCVGHPHIVRPLDVYETGFGVEELVRRPRPVTCPCCEGRRGHSACHALRSRYLPCSRGQPSPA